MNDLFTKKPSQIVMYATATCGDCRRATAFFEDNHIDYLRVAVEGNAEAEQFVKSLNNGSRTVPTIIFPDGSMLVEPSLKELQEKFSIEKN